MLFQIFRVLNKLKNNNSPIRESYISHRGTSEVLDQAGRISSGPVKLTKKVGKNGSGVISGIRKLFLALMTNRLMCDVDASITSMSTTGANYYVVASKI